MIEKKKIVILGKLESKYYAPFNDPNCEIWSMNKHNDEEMIPRVDKWFDLHVDPGKKNADFTRDNFPFDLCHELVHGQRFCSTSAYLIAYAILCGATDIEIYGMRFTPDHPRRARELENVRQLIFFGWGKGINITAPEDYMYLIPEHVFDDTHDFDQ